MLSTVAARTDSSRLDALDPATGAVRRTWRFATGVPTLLLDRGGDVSLAEPASLLPGIPADEREPLRPFALPTPAGDTLRLAQLRGRVAVVNFWASWCGPCREEFPALDSLASTFDTARVRFVGLSEDVLRAAADRFLSAHPAPNIAIAYGDGALRQRYHYVGLPFTVLVDGQGRVVRRWIGFTGPDQLAEIALLAGRESGDTLRTAAPAASPHHH